MFSGFGKVRRLTRVSHFLTARSHLLAVQDGPKFFKTGEGLLFIAIHELYQADKVLRAAAFSPVDPHDIAVHWSPFYRTEFIYGTTMTEDYSRITHGFYYYLQRING